MKNKIKLKGRLLCSLLLLLLAVSCRKDDMLEKTTTPSLSTSSPDLAQRLAAIKRQYHEEKLGARFVAKDEKGITWTPEWDKPRLETVNDSVSYVFYRMIGTLKRDGKLAKVQEIGAATYLMVKNGKDFYKAFYYVPEEKRSKDPAVDVSDAIMKHFTGTLLLSNLKGGRSYLLDYVNGQVSEAYKNNLLASKKLQAVGGATAYWEQQCETVIRHCTFVSAGYSYCGGEIMVIYSHNCHWPQPMCGVTFYMTDSSEESVCQQVWFPDPPNGGGSGGGEDSEVIPEDPYFPGQDKAAIDPKKYVDCFNSIPDVGANYKVIVQVQEPIPGTKFNYNPFDAKRGVGHTAITVTKTGKNGQTITQTVGFYPAGDDKKEKIKGLSKMVDNAKLGDAEQIEFTISMDIDLGGNAEAFDKILKNIANPPTQYDLFGMNCTAFVWGACTNAGITLPNPLNGMATIDDPLNIIQAMTPAGLGNSMRKAKEAGDNRINTTQKTAPQSKGPCN